MTTRRGPALRQTRCAYHPRRGPRATQLPTNQAAQPSTVLKASPLREAPETELLPHMAKQIAIRTFGVYGSTHTSQPLVEEDWETCHSQPRVREPQTQPEQVVT